jgi:hypothetical protein
MLAFDKEKHEYRYKGVRYPSVTQILHAEGFIDTKWFTEYACNRGSYVHQIIHWYLTGELDEDTIDPTLRPYLEAWIRFTKDIGFVSEAVEKPFVSDVYRFAGTPDHIGRLNGHNAVLDVKTGAVQPWTALQLAGYEILIKTPSIERFSLQLTEEGKYKLQHHKDRQDRQIFLSALACYQWKLNNNIGR